MHDGLRHQHPVKRIGVGAWQSACLESGLFIDVQRHNAAGFTDLWHKVVGPCRELKAAQGIFNADFPRRGGTQVTFVAAVQKDCGGASAQPRGCVSCR
jgi:hypothetical protein